MAEIAFASLLISPCPRSGRVVSHSQKSRVGSSSVHVATTGSSATASPAKHSGGMQKGLSPDCSVYAKFLRLTSPNLVVTGPAALAVAAIRPKSNRTFVEVFMV